MYKKVFTLSALVLLVSACGGESKKAAENIQGELTIAGSAEYGKQLKAQITDLDGISNLSNAQYQWQRNSVNIDGATQNSYAISADDFNHKISAVVTYVDDKGFDNSITSAQTRTISAVDLPGTLSINGTAKQDQTLNAELMDGNGFDVNNATFSWFADNQVISGETSQSLILTREQVGKEISVHVNYTDQDNFNNSLTKAQTIVVEPLDNSPGVLSLSGANDEPASLVVGASLQANLDDANTIAEEVTYYWYSGDQLIVDHNQASYTLMQTDVGQSIYVEAKYVDADGYVESVLSSNTTQVTAVDLGIPGGQDYPVGASIVGSSPINRITPYLSESFEGGGWNARTIFPDTYTPGRDTSLPSPFRFVQFQGPHSFVAATNITRVGSYSAKLHWKHDDPGQWNGDPNKVTNNDRKAMFHGRPVSSHTATSWYGFSVYFPSDGITLTGSQNPLIFQLHGAPDKGEPGRQPPIAVIVDKDAFNVSYGWDARAFNTNTAGQGRGEFRIPINFAEDYQDRWVDFVLQVSTNPFEEKGFINLWVDGVQVLGENNLQIGYNDNTGMYPSWGWYQIGENIKRTTDAIMYMDELRHIEDTDADYYDVAPGYFEK